MKTQGKNCFFAATGCRVQEWAGVAEAMYGVIQKGAVLLKDECFPVVGWVEVLEPSRTGFSCNEEQHRDEAWLSLRVSRLYIRFLISGNFSASYLLWKMRALLSADTMLWWLAVTVLLGRAVPHPQATTTGSPCRKDEIYTSLMREDDGEFCQSLMNDHCVTVSTPEAYTSLGDDEISSYVSFGRAHLQMLSSRMLTGGSVSVS
jgi:hypothetical protein